MKIDAEGEGGLFITWPEASRESVRESVTSLFRSLQGQSHPAIREVVPGLESLLVLFDPLAAPAAAMIALLDACPEIPSRPMKQKQIHIPVVYGGEHGPDLGRVAALAGLTEAGAIRAHHESRYEVAFLGFAPHFPYLIGLDPRLHTPRLDTPRVRVPAGSVAIGGAQTGIYPRESPGGWNLIGRTSSALIQWLAKRNDWLEPGDRVLFERVGPLSDPTRWPAHVAPSDGAAVRIGTIVSGGLLTTVQDGGRSGMAHRGVSPSGPMDRLSFALTNRAVGNPTLAPAIELTFPGPHIEFSAPAAIAIGGARLGPRLNRSRLPLYRRVDVRPGDTLTFSGQEKGVWAYLALGGGVHAEPSFGSSSSDIRGGLGAGRLGPGPLFRADDAPLCGADVPSDAAALPENGQEIRVLRSRHPWAPELGGALVEFGLARDRSGYRASTPLFPQAAGDLPSEGVPPGTIQLLSDGRLIFLLAERPTTGGYSKVGFVASVDQRLVAQTPAGSRVVLRTVGRDEALAALREQ